MSSEREKMLRESFMTLLIPICSLTETGHAIFARLSMRLARLNRKSDGTY